MARRSDETDEHWNHFARTDPYWAVLTEDRYRATRLDDQRRREFFDSGEAHIAALLETIRERVSPDFSPRSALDFGCGVGRLVVPLASRCARVVGTDVAGAMLTEARRNCDELAATNVELVLADDELSRVGGTFDLVHSYIVLQHIPEERGRGIFRRLVARIAPGGVGALHVLHSTAATRAGPPPGGVRRRLFRTASKLKRRLGGRRGTGDDGTVGAPRMQMNAYDINVLFDVLRDAGVEALHVEFTHHGQNHGAMLIFRRPEEPRDAETVAREAADPPA